MCPAPCTALSVRCFCQWDCWAPWEGCPYSHQPCLAAARAAVIPAVQTLVHPLEKSFLLQGSPCGHYCLLSCPVSHSRVHSSIWLFGGLAHSSVFWNSQLCEWHIQLLQSTNMYSWVGCALHNSDFAMCGAMHDCTMGRPSPCLPCRVPCSLSISSLFPSLLNFNHLCLRAISALFPEPYPEVELPCRNHKSHASLSALLAPSVPAGPSGEPFVSWGLHLLACPQALFPPLAPLTAPFPQPGDLGRLPRPSGLRLLPQLPLSLISQVGSALPWFNSTWHARPPLPLLPLLRQTIFSGSVANPADTLHLHHIRGTCGLGHCHLPDPADGLCFPRASPAWPPASARSARHCCDCPSSRPWPSTLARWPASSRPRLAYFVSCLFFVIIKFFSL